MGSQEEVESRGFVWNGNSSTLSSHDALPEVGDYPADFTWCNKDGVNYCTQSVNQHIPQYCGSCWAQASMSALSDRIKMARGAKGIDIQLSVQHVLNWQRWLLLRWRSGCSLPMGVFGRRCRVHHWTAVHGLFERLERRILW